MHLTISNDIVSTKIYDKRDDFDFRIVNFPFLDGDVPRSTSYGVYTSQLIRFARTSSYAADFNYVVKRVSLGSKDCTKELKLECAYSWARLASFCHLYVISDPLIGSRFHNKTHDPKGQENKNQHYSEGQGDVLLPPQSLSPATRNKLLTQKLLKQGYRYHKLRKTFSKGVRALMGYFGPPPRAKN